MQNNISKVLDRGSKLEDLQDKTGECILYCLQNGKEQVIAHFQNTFSVYC